MINALRHQRLVHTKKRYRETAPSTCDQRLTASKVSTLAGIGLLAGKTLCDQRLTASKVSTLDPVVGLVISGYSDQRLTASKVSTPGTSDAGKELGE